MAEDDDRELFEAALGEMSRGDVFRGKYGQPAEEAPTPEEHPGDALRREELHQLREQQEMERAFAGISRIDRGKYYVQQPDAGDDADALVEEFEAAMNAGATAPDQPVEAPEVDSLEARAPLDVHTLNLRGFAPDEALGKLGLFVDLAFKDGHQLIRIRVGSNPPTLAAVEQWFRSAGLLYVEELELAQEHADAAIFARFRR